MGGMFKELAEEGGGRCVLYLDRLLFSVSFVVLAINQHLSNPNKTKHFRHFVDLVNISTHAAQLAIQIVPSCTTTSGICQNRIRHLASHVRGQLKTGSTKLEVQLSFFFWSYKTPVLPSLLPYRETVL